jgi:hypothetical protein
MCTSALGNRRSFALLLPLAPLPQTHSSAAMPRPRPHDPDSGAGWQPPRSGGLSYWGHWLHTVWLPQRGGRGVVGLGWGGFGWQAGLGFGWAGVGPRLDSRPDSCNMFRIGWTICPIAMHRTSFRDSTHRYVEASPVGVTVSFRTMRSQRMPLGIRKPMHRTNIGSMGGGRIKTQTQNL